MKKLIVLLVLGILALSIYANPYVPNVISRIWFDSSGDCHLQFGSDLIQVNLHYPSGLNMNLVTGAGLFTMPPSFDPPMEHSQYPLNVNISQLIPDFSINPNQDSLYVFLGEYGLDRLRWGPGEAYGIYLHPLLGDQAAVHVQYTVFPGETDFLWAKENGVNLVNEYTTDGRSTLNIHVSNLSGDPVSNHPVFFYPGHYPYYYQPTHYTDANGNLQIVDYARRTFLGIRDWNYNVLYEQNFFPEPDSVYEVNVIINSVANADPVENLQPGQFKIYPNVVSGPGRNVHISYNKALDHARLCLYDMKGRELTARPFDATGKLDWQVPRLASGVYFIVLKNGERELGREKLVLIK